MENKHYPKMPPEMEIGNENAPGAGTSGQGHMAPAPPSYEQAIASPGSEYPPVQVLPTPREETLNRSQNNTRSPRPQPPPGPQQAFNNTNWTQYNAVPPHSNTGPYGLPPQGPGSPPVVIIQQQAVLPLGPDPVYITCPACHIQKLTRIEYEPSSRTHLMAALLCVLGFWCCVCLPYCAGSCMNANHYCGNCNKFLGTYGGTL